MSDTVDLVRGPDVPLDDLRPLWLALVEHHHAVGPELGPVRADDDTWARRRAQYAEWVADERNFALLARRDELLVGYAFVRIGTLGSPTWEGSGTYADLETLSLLPAARGGGFGTRMLTRFREEAAALGCADLRITAITANTEALKFYEREGFSPAFVTLSNNR